MSTFHVVIPARFASSRLPGKPLADIAGKPMVVHVAERAAASGAASVTVATDDERIRAVVTKAGCDAVLTSVSHQSGSDRILEVTEHFGWDDDALVINVQGDEPLIPARVIQQVAEELGATAQRQVVTLCEPVESVKTLFDAAAVKVVFDTNQRALYFSRAPIPFNRGQFEDGADSITEARALWQRQSWWRHVGIYGYRKRALKHFTQLPTASYESIESLEQLRFLQNGIDVYVFPACEPVPGGIDTPEDLRQINQLLIDT